jgi:hypothetical protein
MKASSKLLSLLIPLAVNVLPARADFEPIALTTNSYSQDIVVERTSPPPVVPVTTASMEQGSSNTGFTWFERGYVTDWPQTGLLQAGSILTSDQGPDHQYQMPFTYQTNNAILIDVEHPQGTATFLIPTNSMALSFLTSSGGIRDTIQYVAHYGDLGLETGQFVSPNWYSDGDPAWAAYGCVDVTTFVRADLNSYNPRLYSVDVILSNAVGPVTSIDFSLISGIGHTAIFAISGSSSLGEVFDPIEIGGYNKDMVVEASAIKPGFMDSNTTATMDNGTANTRCTWYEKGYYSPAPQTGLPEPGSLVTSDVDASHHFLMPPSYTNANAVLIDSVCSKSVLTLLTPASYSALSFLTASGHGPVTNRCVVSHSDGSSETNTFVSPDWLDNNSPAALRSHGRVSLNTKLTDYVNSDRPRLYAVDVPITNSNKPIAKITLSFGGAGPDAHAVIFAVSGNASTSAPTRPVLVIESSPAGKLIIRSTQPGRLQSCSALPCAAAAWKDEGPIDQNVTVAPPAAKTRFYRVMGGIAFDRRSAPLK